MSDAVRKYFCPRLLDYVVIVGARSPSATHSVHVPELLRRYPPDDHKDFPLPPDVVFFCQPEGCVSVGPRRMSLRETNSFVFALTDKDSSKTRFGICVNFYRAVEKRCPSVTRRDSPNLNTNTKDTTDATTDSSKTAEEAKTTADDATPAADARSKARKLRRQQSGVTNSLTSLCLISHHPFFSTFRECLFILKRMIETCSDKNMSSRKSPTSRHSRKYALVAAIAQAQVSYDAICLMCVCPVIKETGCGRC